MGTDNYPGDTSWALFNICQGSSKKIDADGGYKLKKYLYYKTKATPKGRFRFKIDDSYGDGLCCAQGPGKYEVTMDGKVVAKGAEFGYTEVTEFGQCDGGRGGQSNVKVEITTDNYPVETKWTIKDKSSGAVVATGDLYSAAGQLYSKEFDVTANGCFKFKIEDTYGDGICCSQGPGKYEVYLDDSLVASGGEFKKIETKSFGECGGGGGKILKVNIQTDNYPRDTSWKIVQQHENTAGDLVATGGGYPTGGDYTEQGQVYSTEHEAAANGCFEFTIVDAFGDGICCLYGNGYYEVYMNGVVAVEGGSPNFGLGETKKFGECA